MKTTQYATGKILRYWEIQFIHSLFKKLAHFHHSVNKIKPTPPVFMGFVQEFPDNFQQYYQAKSFSKIFIVNKK